MSLAFVRGIHWRPVDSLHKGPVTRKIFPFDYVIMCTNIDMLFFKTAMDINDFTAAVDIEVFDH